MVAIRNWKKFEFRNKCNAIVDEELLTMALLWYDPHPKKQAKTISLHGRYAAVSIGKIKIHVHRLIMNYLENKILPRNLHVNHIDGNKLNNSRSNLEILEDKKHLSLTNRGRTFSQEHKRRLAISTARRKGIITKTTAHITPQILKPLLDQKWSISKISRHLKADWVTIKNRIHQHPELLEKK